MDSSIALFGFIFTVLRGTLLISPVLAVVSALWYRKSGHTAKKWFLVGHTVLCIPLVFYALTDWSLGGIKSDTVLIALAYFAYCGLVAVSLNIHNLKLRLPVFLIGLIPVLLGYILATVGALGLAFVVGDCVPEQEGRLESRLTYRITTFGNATTAEGGNRIALLRSYHLLPGLEREVFTKELDYRDYPLENLTVTIDSSGSSGTLVELLSGDSLIYTDSITD